MKHARKAFALFLSMVILASSTICVIAENDDPTAEETYAPNARMWFDWSRLSDEIPEEYKNYISRYPSYPRDEKAYLEITKIIKCHGSNDLLVSLRGCDYHLVVNYNGSGYEVERRCDSNIYALIVDKENGTPIGFDKFNNELFFSGDFQPDEIKNIAIKLPEYFDINKHKLLFFVLIRYIEVDSYTFETAISEPIEADLSEVGFYGDGDVNNDQKTNLSDVVLMMKYIARWKSDSFDFDSADINIDSKVDSKDVQLLLKNIADWESPDIAPSYFMDQYIAEADKKYEERKIKLLQSFGSSYSKSENGFSDYTVEELESNLIKFIKQCKIRGFAFDDFKTFFPDKEACIYIQQEKNWTRDEFIEFIREVYYRSM